MLPINIRLKNRKVIVIGGGKIAEKRAISLHEAGANVVLISPEVTTLLKKHIEADKILWVRRKYCRGDLKGAFIGVIAINNPEVESIFIEEAAEEGVLINLSSSSKKSDIIFPATVRRGRLEISVSTSGAFPMLSAEIARDIGLYYGDDFQGFIDFLSELREIVIDRYPQEERKKILKNILQKKEYILQQIKEGRKPELDEILAK